MKIAFLSANPGYPWGGSEILWYRTLQLMRQRGHQVAVGIREWDELPPKLAALQAEGVPVHRAPIGGQRGQLPLFQKVANRFRPSAKQVPGPLLREHHFQWLDDFAPDLALLTMANQLNTLGFAQECSKRQIPFALNVQLAVRQYWPDPRQPAEEKVIRMAEEAYQQARRCYFVSPQNQKLTQQQLGRDLPQAEQIWNPFQSGAQAPLPYPDTSQGFRLAMVSNLEVIRKGQDVLLEALADPKWQERPLTFHLFGRGHHEEQLKRLARYLGLKNVAFEGYSSDIDQLWKQHHALVLSSHDEGMPLALIEAVRCGRMGIVTNVGGNAQVIRDGQTGFIAEAATPTLMDQALERAWQARNQWETLGQKAHQHLKTLMPEDPVADLADRLESLAAE